jgi:hypothetical protein
MPLGGLRSSTTAIEARWKWMKMNWDPLYATRTDFVGGVL